MLLNHLVIHYLPVRPTDFHPLQNICNLGIFGSIKQSLSTSTGENDSQSTVYCCVIVFKCSRVPLGKVWPIKPSGGGSMAACQIRIKGATMAYPAPHCLQVAALSTPQTQPLAIPQMLRRVGILRLTTMQMSGQICIPQNHRRGGWCRRWRRSRHRQPPVSHRGQAQDQLLRWMRQERKLVALPRWWPWYW